MPSACSMPFSAIASVEIIGVEAGGTRPGLGDNAATLGHGKPGVLHGTYTMLLQDEDGQIQETHSVSAGLDYPGVGPGARAAARDRPRASTIRRRRRRCAGCVEECCAAEGILPAIEIGARAGGREALGRDSIRASACWSAFRAAATRTCRPCSRRCCKRGTSMLPRDRTPRSARRDLRRGADAGARRVPHRRLPEPREFPPTLRASPPRPTWSRSACRSPTRWPMA